MAEDEAPNPGTKAALEVELARLQADNDRLQAQLAGTPAAYVGRVAVPQHTFQLSEGDRQELEIRGAINVNGRLMTRDDVIAAMEEAGQRGVTIAEAPESTRLDERTIAQAKAERTGVRGVNYVYPSVAPGKIDPAVAGTPGITGPAATDEDDDSDDE